MVQVRATAMSVYNVGIYTGFAFSQSVGTQIASDSDSWKAPYYVFGFIGA